jgi:hypothetical protein
MIVAALTVNHLIHGFGCWGFARGGHFSADLYGLQILVAAIAMILGSYSILRIRPPRWPYILSWIWSLFIVAIALFFYRGWQIFSSIHYQGSENLLPFITASLSAIVAGHERDCVLRDS